VLRAYPADYRRRYGPELGATALALEGGRWSSEQAITFVIEGVRTRARISTGATAKGVWAGSARLALWLHFLQNLLRMLPGGSETGRPATVDSIVLGAAALGMLALLAPRSRWAALAGVLAVAGVEIAVVLVPPMGGWYIERAYGRFAVTVLLIGGLAWWVMAVGIARETRPGPTLARLAAALGAVAAALTLSQWLWAVVMLTWLLSVAGVTIDPRIAGSAAVTFALSQVWVIGLMVEVGPIQGLLAPDRLVLIATLALVAVAVTSGTRRLAST
jgi:hypothetical protein